MTAPSPPPDPHAPKIPMHFPLPALPCLTTCRVLFVFVSYGNVSKLLPLQISGNHKKQEAPFRLCLGSSFSPPKEGYPPKDMSHPHSNQRKAHVTCRARRRRGGWPVKWRPRRWEILWVWLTGGANRRCWYPCFHLPGFHVTGFSSHSPMSLLVFKGWQGSARSWFPTI